MFVKNTYAVLDKDGNVVNVIVWDKKSEWEPPKGCTIEFYNSGKHEFRKEA